MKLPRLRFTVRRMMAAVAVLAVVLGMLLRAVRFHDLADYHRGQMILARPLTQSGKFGAYHFELSQKYARAARYPWLPVEHDPPEPK